MSSSAQDALVPEPAVAHVTTSPVATVFVAGFWRRLAAAVVDGLCLAPALAVADWLAFRVTGLKLPAVTELRFENVLELFLEGGSPVYGVLAVALMIGLLYLFLFIATTGATPGLRLLRLRVISVWGEAPEWWRVLLRCIGVVAGGLLLGLGWVWIGFDREKRALHDWLAGTYVIRRPT